MRTERGSGSAATLILVAGVMAVTSFLLLAGSALISLDRAQHTTDQAALEAADAASGRIPGYPCDRAERLAEKNHIIFGSCLVDGLVSRVTFQVTVLGFLIETKAKAGPQNLAQ